MSKWKRADFPICKDCKYLKLAFDWFMNPEWVCIYPFPTFSKIDEEHDFDFIDGHDDPNCSVCHGLWNIWRCFEERKPYVKGYPPEQYPRMTPCRLKEERSYIRRWRFR